MRENNFRITLEPDPLLCLAARVNGRAYYPPLIQAAGRYSAWPTLAGRAENHGLGPLLYTHLTAAGAAVPLEARRELQALYLRHRHANRVRSAALAEILDCFEAAGIRALVLKGAALAYLVYPDPGQRPMRDMDLLVRKAQARPAQVLLAGLGFEAPLPGPGPLPGKHLAAATRSEQGLSLSVEIHHNLFSPGRRLSLELEDLASPPAGFTLAGRTAFTLPYEPLLWHLCQHLLLMRQPLRLIWVADIVGLAERFAGQIDWDLVARRYPLVLSTLSLLHFLTPLPADLLAVAPVKIGPRPEGVGQEFDGWPRQAMAGQHRKGWPLILRDTFWPPEWWLRLYYGLGSAGPLVWGRWLGHPLQVLAWAGQLMLERAGLREPDE